MRARLANLLNRPGLVSWGIPGAMAIQFQVRARSVVITGEPRAVFRFGFILVWAAFIAWVEGKAVYVTWKADPNATPGVL